MILLGLPCAPLPAMLRGAVLGLAALAIGCAAADGGAAGPDAGAPSTTAEAREGVSREVGVASFYARHFRGRRMANGQRFDPASDTVAHRTLPFGTVVRVTNLANGRSATGRVRDRGPWIRGRILDLSPRLARELGMIGSGLAQVELVPLEEVAEAAE
jgi:rare lipoprotein A